MVVPRYRAVTGISTFWVITSTLVARVVSRGTRFSVHHDFMPVGIGLVFWHKENIVTSLHVVIRAYSRDLEQYVGPDCDRPFGIRG